MWDPFFKRKWNTISPFIWPSLCHYLAGIMGFREFLKTYKKQIPPTVILYLCFGLTGARVVLIGSSILDLQIRIQESFSLTSRLLTSHSAGYLAGAVVGKRREPIFVSEITSSNTSSYLGGGLEKYFNTYLISSTALVIAGIFLGITPWLYSFYGTAVCLFFLGVGNSTFDIGRTLKITV